MFYIIDLSQGIPQDFEKHLLELKEKNSPTLQLKGALPHIETIQSLINKHRLCYPVTLIGHTHSANQLAIDELIWQNLLESAMQQSADPLTKKKPQKSLAKRTRPQPQPNQSVTVNIDVDVAFQTEVVEELDTEENIEEITESQDLPHIDFDQFSQILRDQSQIATSSPERRQLWYRIMGKIAVYQKGDERIDISEDDSILRDLSIDYDQVQSKAHPMVKGMSEDAAKAIAINPNAFIDGIDYHHLPTGFRLVRKPNDEDAFTLDYQETDKPNYDGLALSVFTQKEPLPLSKMIASTLLSKAPVSTKKLLDSAHRALMEKNYDSNDLQAFRQNLPLLITLHADSLSSLIRLCHDQSKGHLDANKLHYYVHNREKLLRMLENAAEKADVGNDYIHVKTFCHDKVFQGEAFFAHPGLNNLSESQKVFLSELNNYYHFNWKQLDSLWHLHATQGDSALHKVLNTLRELQPENGKTYQFFQHVNDLSQLLDKQPWQAAFKQLTGMDEQQKAWWETLISKHMANTNEDDMLTLLKQFTQFSRQIHSLELKFYTPVSFEHVRSMPVALSRMLTILNNCQHENLAQQWACLTDLPLQASGAIRAIEESSVKEPCSFVTPKMGLTAVHYEFSEDNDKGYQTVNSAKDILEYLKRTSQSSQKAEEENVSQPNSPQTLTSHSPTLEDVDPTTEEEKDKKNDKDNLGDLISLPDEEKMKQATLRGLYRYLAWTPHKAPLSFYQQAVDNIDTVVEGMEWQNLTASFAYIQMAGATTGLLNSAKAKHDPKQSHDDLIKLITYFKYMNKLPGWLNSLGAKKWIRIMMLGVFALMKVSPDPKEAYSLVGLFDQIFEGLTVDWQWLTNFSGKINSIVQPLNNMQPLLLESDSDRLKSFLNSMRFLDYSNLDQITYHLSEIRALGEMLQGTPITSKEDLAKESWEISKKITELLKDELIAASYLKLIGLKSQFGINYENMHQLKGLDLNNPTTVYALDLLSKMTHNQDLTIEKLVSFIRALPGPIESDSSQPIALDYESVVNATASLHTINYKMVHQQIKHTFGQYYDESFFNSLTDVALDKAIIEQIKNALPPSIARDTCLHFFKRFPKTEHAELVSDLLILANQMKEDKEEFVLSLTDDRVFELTTAMQLKEVLQLLNQNGDSKSWLFILRALKRSQNDKEGFGDYAKNALSFWLEHLTPRLNQIKGKVSLLPANLYEIIYSGFEAGYWQKNDNLLNKMAETWTKFCLDLAEKPIACEPLLALMQKMITDGRYSHSRLKQLRTLVTAINDKTALSLATYFQDNRIGLLERFLDHLFNHSPDGEQLTLIVTILEKHANADLTIDNDALALLFEFDNHDWLAPLYQSPPYPSVSQVAKWKATDNVKESYRQFCLSPCERNDLGNGFYHEQARMKALEHIAFTPELGIRPLTLRVLQDEAIWAKAQTIETLKDALAKVATSQSIDYERLTTISAELLHRSMGREGNAYELNETQYLAVYKALRDGSLGPLTGKFDSGEGKTRVFMVIAGALLAQGKTVDFITRNMTLAKREYMNYQSYFDLLGAKTAVIQSQSTSDEFKNSQIHFSDVSQFSLYMNQQLSQNNDPRPVESLRALLLDEADQTYFDAYQTRYNYATTTVNYSASMNWVYDTLIEFFQNETHQTLYYADVDGCNEAFRDFVANHLGEEQMQQLQAVSDDQLETWHDAAMTALQLSYEHDFNVSLDEVITVPGKGRQLYSRAVVVKDNREQRESSFANGVQQCLHARLNWTKKHPDMSALSKAISKAQHPFVVRPESEIIYFNTSKGFLDDYANSTLIAFTGTTGSELEQTEVQSLFNMTFIDFPRHNKLKREDLPLRLCSHEKAQLDALVENIRSLQAANQPVLIICEDDKESALLTEKLKAYFDKGSLTRIHSGCSSDVEQRHADQVAGQSNHITITTDMYARGVDIKLHGQAKTNGLGVLLTYMPGSEREYIQSINRAGRYGCHGTSRMILNKERLIKQLGVSSLPSSFFIHSGVPERQAMTNLNIPKQKKRIVSLAITDFQRQLEKVFFAHHFDKEEKARSLQLKSWTRFDKTIRQMWDRNNNELEKALSQTPIPEERIAQIVNQYGEDVKALWQKTFPDMDIAQSSPKVAAVFNTINAMKPNYTAKKPAFSKYDRSHDGFAVLYDHWFAETRAWWRGERCMFANTRAWLRGEGTIFANLKAWWRGEITLWEYLFPVGLEKQVEKKADLIELPSTSSPAVN
ncbi:helicase-related protein [Legionella sp. W05-934-2]|uniref:preprotein translocase subunit SecA n=1 Tax=Legionella sp. W05-934-2 TaxID=1198649 RepID=UPI00346196DB